MNALMNEVNAQGLSLIIQVLEFTDKVHQGLVTLDEFFVQDTMPLEEMHT
jgi:hypothetical protein